MDWSVESLRATGFHAGEVVAGPKWWDGVVGEPPEERVSKPREGVHRDAGPFGKAQLALAISPIRTDWVFSARPDLEAGLPIVGEYSEVSSDFLGVVRRWLGVCAPLTRLAFGSVLLQPVSSKEEAYTRLASYLQWVQIDPVGSNDFFYQINRPCASRVGIANLLINRLSKWSALEIHRVALDLAGLHQPAAIRAPAGEAVHACRLELDINTSVAYEGDLPASHLSELFDELAGLGMEIAAEGDTK